jgi:glycosyltransferase involved in cell wall biosynthesis
LKTNHGRGTTIDREVTSSLVKSLLSEVRKSDFPKIHLIHGNLYPGEIAGLYRNKSIKGLVSLTRGEGFGLPLLEAAAAGIPVIATGWSAHTEFLSNGKFINIDYDLIDIPSEKVDNRIFVNNSKWADPHEDDFKKKILKFRQKTSIPDMWANDLSLKIRDLYSKESIFKIYDEVLSEILY